MKQRVKYILLSAAGLLLGLPIYLTLRNGTYIHRIFGLYGEKALIPAKGVLAGFVKYNLPDFLWAFSLCCALHAVLLPDVRRSALLSLCVALCGCAWEVMQLAGILRETFDPLDCIMCFIAAFAVTGIVKYVFTNNNKTPTAFNLAVADDVFQDGIGPNDSFFLADSADYSSDNKTKKIKKGSTLEVESAYELNDLTTDITVEVSELISFSDKKVTRTFSIAP